MAFGRRIRRRSRPLRRKIGDAVVVVAILAGATLLAARLERYSQPEISGVARVVDGDSLAIGKRRLRLMGIDAPEIAQNCRRDGRDYDCGVEAATYLRGLVGANPVDCRAEGVDRYGRDLVRCIAGGKDLNEAMVRAGHAVAFGDYRVAEAAARKSRSGVWAGEFDPPKQWRAVHGGLDEDWHVGFGPVLAFLRHLFGV
ncbi:thermonuclease family protein [Hoeflea sp. G2-23]|uniref:Thermonuclease family protein n=1 Tax=Hoeflea algicola TaxID=2983763 RepID=A0ABT3Z6X6_9HYPH|nr:thermonuclease family protein [Hoeflea algicola]MCY0147393.1 thermonuclease family protein [Hoeflea algicola]